MSQYGRPIGTLPRFGLFPVPELGEGELRDGNPPAELNGRIQEAFGDQVAIVPQLLTPIWGWVRVDSYTAPLSRRELAYIATYIVSAGDVELGQMQVMSGSLPASSYAECESVDVQRPGGTPLPRPLQYRLPSDSLTGHVLTIPNDGTVARIHSSPWTEWAPTRSAGRAYAVLEQISDTKARNTAGLDAELRLQAELRLDDGTIEHQARSVHYAIGGNCSWEDTRFGAVSAGRTIEAVRFRLQMVLTGANDPQADLAALLGHDRDVFAVISHAGTFRDTEHLDPNADVTAVQIRWSFDARSVWSGDAQQSLSEFDSLIASTLERPIWIFAGSRRLPEISSAGITSSAGGYSERVDRVVAELLESAGVADQPVDWAELIAAADLLEAWPNGAEAAAVTATLRERTTLAEALLQVADWSRIYPWIDPTGRLRFAVDADPGDLAGYVLGPRTWLEPPEISTVHTEDDRADTAEVEWLNAVELRNERTRYPEAGYRFNVRERRLPGIGYASAAVRRARFEYELARARRTEATVVCASLLPGLGYLDRVLLAPPDAPDVVQGHGRISGQYQLDVVDPGFQWDPSYVGRLLCAGGSVAQLRQFAPALDRLHVETSTPLDVPSYPTGAQRLTDFLIVPNGAEKLWQWRVVRIARDYDSHTTALTLFRSDDREYAGDAA